MGRLENGIWQEAIGKDFYDSSLPNLRLDAEKLPLIPLANRYILYTSLAAPLAHCGVLVRAIKELEDIVNVCIVSAVKDKNGWQFKKTELGTSDRYNDCQYLYELYKKKEDNYSGLVTLPLIWDNQENKIITDCPFGVMRFLNNYFNPIIENKANLYPKQEERRIESFQHFLIDELYIPIFQTANASTQEEYNKNSRKIFNALNELESLLKHQQTLLGTEISINDWFLFCILIRFDVIFKPLFRLNAKSIDQYPALRDYMTELYQEKHIGCTVNIDHIKEHYYKSYLHLNPYGIIPDGPEVKFDFLFNRFSLF